MTQIIDIATTPLSKKRAVEAWNKAMELLGRPEEDKVVKFVDTTTASLKIVEARDAIKEKFGFVELRQAESGDLRWATEASAPADQQGSADASGTTKAEKKPAAPRSTVDETAKIAILKPNPKRPGSKAHQVFECYADGATVKEFIAAVEASGKSRGDALANLKYDEGHGYIRVGDAPAQAQPEAGDAEAQADGGAPVAPEEPALAAAAE